MSASGIIRAGVAAACRPWPRFELTQEAWFGMVHALESEPGLGFVALWADAAHVHALFEGDTPLVASVAVEAGLYAALSPGRPGAALFERAVADVWGHQAAAAVDVRPWLDHGTWPMLRPLSERPVPNTALAEGAEPEVPDMLEVEGDAVLLGPLGAGPSAEAPLGGALGVAPAVWRVTVHGARVRRLEARLGWGHRGVLGLMRGKSAAGAAKIAARIDGAACVAHGTAFARAVEAAAGFAAPPSAVGLRVLALALERAAVGLHDLAATAGALGQALPLVVAVRERLAAACGAAFGHRLMMDVVRPGGVAADVPATALAALDAVLEGVHADFDAMAWPGVGILALEDALALGVPGTAGRASGRLDGRAPRAALRVGGSVADRMGLLAAAVAADLEAARVALANVPVGDPVGILPHGSGEGLGVADGPHGPVWHWVRLAGGVVAASFAAGPEWLLLPAAERAAAGVRFEEVAGVVASFGVRAGGMDL